MRELVLPSWAKALGKGKVEIDVSEMYPEMLLELDFDDVDQYTLNVALQCAKLDVQRAVAGTAISPITGGALTILIIDPEKDPESGSAWAFKNHPEGKGADAASKGHEARSHYRRIRGSSF